MNRELKVPAALAIMLVGFAAMVLSFEKPQDDAGAETAHEDFSDIDAEIQDRPHTPHLTGLESPSDAPAAELGAQDSSSNDDSWLSWLNGTDEANTDLVSEEKRTTADAAAEPKQQSDRDQELITSRPIGGGNSLGPAPDDLGDRGAAAPAPIQPIASPVASTDRTPRHNEGWDVVAPSEAEELRKHPLRPQVTQRQTYIIQPGDTLSRIAAKFLDGSHRAADIYEANRDVLTDPNQLRVGTEIVIPNRQVAPPQPVVKPNGPVAESPSASRTERSSNRNSLFVPVSSNPLRNSISELPGNSQTNIAPANSPRQYTVRRGDSLERIAMEFYGSRGKALDIYRANVEQLASPNAIREGMTLTLP